MRVYPNFRSGAPPEDRVPDPDSIERSDIVQRREDVLNATSWFFVSGSGGPHRAKAGDCITVTMSSSTNVTDVLRAIGLSVESIDDQVSIVFQLSAVWCVGGAPPEEMTTPSCTTAADMSRSEMDKKTIASLSAAAGPSDSEEEGESSCENRLLPGDICGILNKPGDKNEETSYVCLLVSRFWKDRDGVSSHRVLWYRWNEERTRIHTWCRHTTVYSMHLANVDSCRKGKSSSCRDCDLEMNHGIPQDGTRYIVYRILLYCDDFQPKASFKDTESVGGVYMIPLGLPPAARRSREAVRLIALTPPGISSNEVLLHIIPDIVNATKNGVEGLCPCGHKVQIFVDAVQYVADYPASSHTTDVVGNQCNAPCTICTFRKDVTGNRSALASMCARRARPVPRSTSARASRLAFTRALGRALGGARAWF